MLGSQLFVKVWHDVEHNKRIVKISRLCEPEPPIVLLNQSVNAHQCPKVFDLEHLDNTQSGTLSLTLLADGTVDINKLVTATSVYIQTSAGLNFKQPIEIPNLSVKADQVSIYAPLTVSDQIIVKAKTLDNHSVMTSNQLSADVKQLNNAGNILSNFISAKLNLPALDKNCVDQNVMQNTGLISGLNELILEVNGRVLNHTSGRLCSEGLLKAYGNLEFENSGQVLAKTIAIKTRFHCHNTLTGVMIAEDELALHSTRQPFINAGLLFSNNDCRLSSQFYVHNKQTGKIFAVGFLRCQLTPAPNRPVKQVENEGLISGVKGVNFISGEHAINTASGKIISDARILLLAAKSMYVAGSAKGGGPVDFCSGQNMRIPADSNHHSDDKLSVKSLGNMKIHGILEGKKGLGLHTLMNLLAAEGAELQSGGPLAILTHLGFLCGAKVTSTAPMSVKAGHYFHLLVTGALDSASTMSLKTERSMKVEGLAHSVDKMDVFARDTFSNKGRLHSEKEVSIRTFGILENLLQGIILTGEKLNLFSAAIIDNNGLFQSHGTASIHAGSLLSNLKEGRVVAHSDLVMFAGFVLSNAGKVLGDDKVSLEAVHWLKNMLEGEVTALGDLSAKSGYRLDNHGVMQGKKFMVEALAILRNHPNAEMSGDTLTLISKSFADNAGVLSGASALTLDVRLILEHHAQGKISAGDALSLINATIIKISGDVRGDKDVSISAQAVLEVSKDATVNAGKSLTMLSEFAMQNSGILTAEHIHMEAKKLLVNRLESNVTASQQFVFKTEGVATNEGQCSGKNVTGYADYLHNYSTGKIKAIEVLEVMVKEHAHNRGLLEAHHLKLAAKTFSNHGTIKTFGELSIQVSDIFEHCHAGRIDTEGAVKLLAKHLYLFGQMMAKGDLTATVEKHFDYNTETLWAAGLIKLMLKCGYDFTKPINTPGSLWIETEGNFAVHKKGMFAGGSLTVNAQNIQVGEAVPQTQHTVVSDGAYLASQGPMHLKANTIKNTLGEIYSNDNLILEALLLIENSGNITVAGSAQVIAPLFKHQLLTQKGKVLSPTAPTMTVSGNAHFASSIDMLGAHLHVGGVLSQAPGMNFFARSFEEYKEWTESHTVKGRKKPWYKGGGRHRSTTQVTHHRQTTKVYDSHVSAGAAIHLDHINQLITQGALRTPQLNASFQEFHHGNSFTSPLDFPFQERIECQAFFRENALFGRVNDGPYVYAPKVPFDFNIALMPKVHLESALVNTNLGLFSPMIEKDLIQKILQQFLRTGYIDSSAGSPEAVFAQLRKNAHDYFVGPVLEVTDTQAFSVDLVPEDGNCLFESCLRAIKAISPPEHPVHRIATHQAMRAMVVESLPTKNGDIRARVHTAVVTGESAMDMFAEDSFGERLEFEHQQYRLMAETLGEDFANHRIIPYLDEAPAAYIANMREPNIWGGDIELGIIGERLQVNIHVHHVVNTIRGYLYQHTEEIGNDPTRPTIALMYTGNHYNTLKPKVSIPVTEVALRASPKALLVYQLQNFEGRPTSAPILFIPEAVRHAIGTGRSDQAVVRAENAHLIGDYFRLTGKFQVDAHLQMEINSLIVQQNCYTENQRVKRNRKQGYIDVSVQKAVPDTGVLSAGTLNAKLNTLQQIGGHIRSGVGGTYLEIRDSAFVQALMTTEAVQGKISRKGRNYQIEPVFIPAKMTSDGNQTIIVIQGSCTAEGMFSSARGKNTLEALKGIDIRGKHASYELSSHKHRGRFLGSKRSETGGTAVSHLESVFSGGQGIIMTAQEGMIRLVNTLLISDGDATLKAKTMVSILNDTVTTSHYAKKRRFKGFSYNKHSMHQSTSLSLGSQAFINGSLNITAGEEIRLRNLMGVVAGDMSLNALHVVLEGALEQSNTTHKTKSLGVSFCGSSSLEALMAGENGRAAVQQLLREDTFVSALERLSHLSGSGDAIVQATQTIIESWRLATLIANACDTPNGSGDVLGSLTDRWGLTTPTKDASGNVTGHEFNPKITLSFNQSTVTTKNTRMAPTTLMIGGTLHIAADIIQLVDGTQIAADNIQLHARKLLEIRAAQHTTTTSCHQQGGSVSFRVNGDFAGASAYESKHHSETVHYQNTCLKARNLLSILNEGKTIIQGAELTGVDVMIKTTELLFESLQDTHHASGHSNGVCIDPEGNGGVQSAKESAHKAWVNHPSFINAERSLDLFVDHLSQNGSVLSADQRLRVQGLNQEAPLQWSHEDIQDSESSSSKAISLSSNGQNDSFPLTGFAQFKKSHKQGVTRATVAAPNTVGTIPAGIKRDVHQAQEVLSTKKSNIGVPIVCPNVPKIKEDAVAMSESLTRLKATFQQPKKEAEPPSLKFVSQKTVKTGKKREETIIRGVDTCYDPSENREDFVSKVEELIFQKAKSQIPDVDENKLRQIIKEQLEQYPTPQSRAAFVKRLEGQQDGFQKVGLGAIAKQAIVFVTALAGIGISRYQDWKKRNADFPAEQESEAGHDFTQASQYSKQHAAKAQVKERVVADVQKHIDRKGCGLLDNMSNDQVVQGCVDLADKSHTAAELFFNFNPEPNAKGIYRHTSVAICLKEVQTQCQNRNIETEQSWRNGIELDIKDPKLGSVRLDARDTVNNVVYDYKFGQAKLEDTQIEKIQKHVPDKPATLVVKEVLTTERGGITTKAVGTRFTGQK